MIGTNDTETKKSQWHTKKEDKINKNKNVNKNQVEKQKRNAGLFEAMSKIKKV